MNLAVVDIGSNSTRLLVARRERQTITELVRRSEVTRLGAGVDAEGRLAETAMERVFVVLTRYRELIDAHDASAAVAVLTSAVRDSANGRAFAATVRERFGLEPHVLSGEEEARLTYLGAVSERDPRDRTPTLVLDIGGGSTEMVIGEGGDVRFHVSTQAGVVRQSERHLTADPPSRDEIDALVADVEAILAEAVPGRWRRAVQRGVAVAGTATSLAAIEQRLEPYDPARVHGYAMSAAGAEAILEELTPMDLATRRAVPGLHPDRAPTILGGVIIFRAVLATFGLAAVEISEHDILRGAALGLVGTQTAAEGIDRN